MRVSVALAAVVLVAVLAGRASAGPINWQPMLLTYGNIEGHPYATWQNGQNSATTWAGCFSELEIAKDDPTVDTSGAFLPEHVVLALHPSTTNDTNQWTAPSILSAGTYYVHVANQQMPTQANYCAWTPSGVNAWSTIGKFVITGPAAATTTAPTITATPTTTTTPTVSPPKPKPKVKPKKHKK